MDSEMGHLCNLRILMAAVKMKFSVEIFCFVLLIFAQNIYCGHTLEQK